EWKTVVSKKNSAATKKDKKGERKTPPSLNANNEPARRRKPPRTAAVTIKVKDESISYAEIIKKARGEISLSELQIENQRIRKGINGSIIIEIAGQDSQQKADTLAQKLTTVLEKEAKISRPTIKAELKISGLDDSVTSTEIEFEVAEAGGCSAGDVRSSEIRWMRNGLGTAWIRCPLEAANKINEKGKLKIGWTIAKVELLKKRPLQCFKCWAFGHIGFSCTSTVNRQGYCYFCGNSGHTSRTCKAESPDCLLCKEKNLKSNHRLGSATC
ncbi:hypothetical protein EAG_11695, partial [Camponotus floridanus]